MFDEKAVSAAPGRVQVRKKELHNEKSQVKSSQVKSKTKPNAASCAGALRSCRL